MRTRFTLNELLQFLSMEVTRADASFRQSQVLANAALARDLIPGNETIATSWLEVSELTLDVSLIPVRAGLLQSLKHRIAACYRALAGKSGEPEIMQHYEFSAAEAGGMRMTLAVKRQGNGTFTSETVAA